MPIVRRKVGDITEAEREKLLSDLAALPEPNEEQIERWAEEDGETSTDVDLDKARVVHPAPSPDEIKALRARLGLSQVLFAHRFGFSVDAIQQYEQGRRRPTGPAVTLLRVIAAEPEAVARAVGLAHR